MTVRRRWNITIAGGTVSKNRGAHIIRRLAPGELCAIAKKLDADLELRGVSTLLCAAVMPRALFSLRRLTVHLRSISSSSSSDAFVATISKAEASSTTNSSMSLSYSQSLSSLNRLIHRRVPHRTMAFLSPLAVVPTRHRIPTRAVSSRHRSLSVLKPCRVQVPSHAVICAKTQQETEWNECSVLVNDEICEDHHIIVVNVGTTGSKGSLCDAYRYPGMFVKLRIGDNESFFAISNAPNILGMFEFLVKKTEGSQWICDVKKGDTVLVSPVMGKGFPISKLDLLQYPEIPEEKKPLDIYLFATGSGIAPIRASIESLLNGVNPKQRRSVTLYYGARYEKRMPYMDRFKLWEEDGVTVIPVLSQPEEGWLGKRGYVQHILKERGVDHPAQSGVLLCGLKDMAIDVKKYMTECGVDEDRILTNF